MKVLTRRRFPRYGLLLSALLSLTLAVGATYF